LCVARRPIWRATMNCLSLSNPIPLHNNDTPSAVLGEHDESPKNAGFCFRKLWNSTSHEDHSIPFLLIRNIFSKSRLAKYIKDPSHTSIDLHINQPSHE